MLSTPDGEFQYRATNRGDTFVIRTRIGLGLVRREGADGLGGEGATIDREQDPAGDARLQQAVDLVDHGEGFAGAGCHRHEQLPFPRRDRRLRWRALPLLDRCHWLLMVNHSVVPCYGSSASNYETSLEVLTMEAREELTIRFPPGLLTRAKEAKSERESLNDFVVDAVDREVRRRRGLQAYDEILRVRDETRARTGVQADSSPLIRALREGDGRRE
jgi:hypothetical protein